MPLGAICTTIYAHSFHYNTNNYIECLLLITTDILNTSIKTEMVHVTSNDTFLVSILHEFQPFHRKIVCQCVQNGKLFCQFGVLCIFLQLKHHVW